jgi:sporulation protein YlmC with PRC-barrel domain
MDMGDKPLSKDELVSMQVVDAKGRLVGKVSDVVFEVGKTGISLAVENKKGEVQTVAWEDIQAASDFILLKPPQAISQVQPQQETISSKASQPICPTCGKPLTWIDKYKRWYCYNDKKYV